MILVLCTGGINWEDMNASGSLSSRDKLGGNLLSWSSVQGGSAERTCLILVLCPAGISWEDMYDPSPMSSRGKL